MISPRGRRVLIQLITLTIPFYWLGHQHLLWQTQGYIQPLQAKFPWKDNPQHRTWVPIAWGKLTGPIHEGGRGSKKLEEMNQAFPAQTVWRFLENLELFGFGSSHKSILRIQTSTAAVS